MRALGVLVLPSLFGCQVGGGPTFGFHNGKPVIGLDVGAGVRGSRGQARFDFGGTKDDGTYAALTGGLSMPFDASPLEGFYAGTLSIGRIGEDPGDGSDFGESTMVGLSLGGGVFQTYAHSMLFFSMSVGVREGSDVTELYVAPRLDLASKPLR
jgi:hypothetical protein